MDVIPWDTELDQTWDIIICFIAQVISFSGNYHNTCIVSAMCNMWLC